MAVGNAEWLSGRAFVSMVRARLTAHRLPKAQSQLSGLMDFGASTLPVECVKADGGDQAWGAVIPQLGDGVTSFHQGLIPPEKGANLLGWALWLVFKEYQAERKLEAISTALALAAADK